MIRTLFEFMLCLVMIAIALKPVRAASHLCCEACNYQAFAITSACSVTRKRINPGSPGSGPSLPGKRGRELPDRIREPPGLPGKRERELPDRVRESSRTLSGPSRQEGLPDLVRAFPARQTRLLLTDGGIS